MKIRNKLALYSTLLFGSVLLVSFIYNYYISFSYARNNFLLKLEDRCYINGKQFFEKDIKSKGNSIEYFKKLPYEAYFIYDENGNNIFKSKEGVAINESQLKKIKSNKKLNFEIDRNLYTGIIYQHELKDYIVITTGINIEANARLRYLLMLWIIGFCISLIITYILGYYFAKNTLKPINNIIRQAKEISASNLGVRIEESKNKDEIRELASTFNSVLQRLESSFEIQQTFVSNASHELRTPLTSMISELEILLLKERGSEEYKEAIKSLLSQTLQLKDFINNLLNIVTIDISHNNKKNEEIRIDEMLYELKKNVEIQKPNQPIKLEIKNLPEDPNKLIINGNKQLLMAAFNNFIDNAGKFSHKQLIVLTLDYKDNKIYISINDQGIGIKEEEIKKLFLPFYRANNAIEFPGHGIGLSLADKIIKYHGGEISIDSKVNEGTTVNIFFS